jgi:hypothetical protein
MINTSYHTEHYMYHLFSSQSVGVCTPIAFMFLAVALPTTFHLLLFMFKRVNVIYSFDFNAGGFFAGALFFRTRVYVDGETPCEMF